MTQPANFRNRTDVLLLAAFCGFFFFYGLGAFGLLGADEPRYAQIAREMLSRGDWITPTLLGKPWLEKPVLYYWQAMLAFRMAGVSDHSARLPGAFDATLLVLAVYLFLRRFRPGSELDGALIVASCAGVVGFAHAAATDMPLAAAFGIALLAWYAWYESRNRIYLVVFYVALALGTLAKGPVAPALAAVIIFLFLSARRELAGIWRTAWLPGILTFFLIALPWYVAVQLRNPEFFHFFFFEQNLARFSTNVYHHHQPWWFFVPVFLLATMPWTVILIAATAARVRLIWREKEKALASEPWPLFLLTWMFVPILFFSASHSKLPGYIVPAVPAGGLLAAEYLFGRRATGKRLQTQFAFLHGIACGLLVFVSFTAGTIAINRHLLWGRGSWIAAGSGTILAIMIIAVSLSRAGPRLLRSATLLAVVVSIAAVIRFAAPAIDVAQSARPIAQKIREITREEVYRIKIPLAIYRIKREQQYGLEFYLNRPAQKDEDGAIPPDAHVVVAAQGTQSHVAQLAAGRRVSYLTSIPEQKLDLYWVSK